MSSLQFRQQQAQQVRVVFHPVACACADGEVFIQNFGVEINPFLSVLRRVKALYESGIPILGNFFFAWKKLEKLLNKPATATGWFFRGATHHIELKLFESENEKIKSYAKFWMMFGVIFMFLFVGLFLLLLAPGLFTGI